MPPETRQRLDALPRHMTWPGHLRHRDSGRLLATEHGRLLVPSNHAEAESPPIALSYVRVPAKRDIGLPPLVVLVGGPGVAAIRSFETGLFKWVEEMSAICDVVTFDQRGCHTALPRLDNPFRVELDWETPASRESYLQAHRANAGRLAAHWRERGVDLNAYNTIESARDVDALRQALGVERINLHGASYGSHLALAVLKYHGEHVERAILCIVEGPNDTHKLPANTDRHFRHVADLARESPELKGQCPDLLAELRTVLDAYDAEPLLLEASDASGQRRRAPMGKFAVQLLLGRALGSRREIAKLPTLARQLARRSAAPFARFERWLHGYGLSGMMLAMDCASGASAERLEAIEAQRPDALLDDAFNLPFPFVGDALGVADLGEAFRAPVETDTPALLCSGTLDGRTPIGNAQAAMAGLRNSRHIVVEGASHETPDLLAAPQMDFLRGRETGVERLAVPFEFQALDG